MTALEQQKLNQAVAMFIILEELQAKMLQQHQELVELLCDVAFPKKKPEPPKLVRIK